MFTAKKIKVYSLLVALFLLGVFLVGYILGNTTLHNQLSFISLVPCSSSIKISSTTFCAASKISGFQLTLNENYNFNELLTQLNFLSETTQKQIPSTETEQNHSLQQINAQIVYFRLVDIPQDRQTIVYENNTASPASNYGVNYQNNTLFIDIYLSPDQILNNTNEDQTSLSSRSSYYLVSALYSLGHEWKDLENISNVAITHISPIYQQTDPQFPLILKKN